MTTLPLLLAASALAAPNWDRLVSLRRELHRHPELGNREIRTMRSIAEHLRKIGATDIREGAAKTGVIATLKGGKGGPIVALRAPIDAYEIQEKNDLPYKSEISGVSHACGHDSMTAMVLGAAEILKEEGFAGQIRLLFQPAEEGSPPGEEAGAALMLKEGALAGVSSVIAMHVDTDLAEGAVGLHTGAVYAGADTLEISIEGSSAHGATPWKGVDSIAIAGQMLSAIALITARQTDLRDPIVLTVGTVSGGTRPNGIAGQTKLSGTLRSWSPSSRKKARESLMRVVRHVAEAFGAKSTLLFSEELPPTLNDKALVEKLRPVLEKEVRDFRILEPLSYADDFAFMSEKVPSFYFQLGMRDEKKGQTATTHTEDFKMDETTIPIGARILARLARRALEP